MVGQHPQLQAIMQMLSAMFCLSVMNVTLRMMSGDMHPTQIVVLRHVCSIVIIFIWAAYLQRGVPSFYSNRLSGHFWRATLGVCSMEMWFYSVTTMPVSLVTALSFTTPIFSTILAILFLGERAGVRRWLAIAVSFIGMLIILRPDTAGVNHSGWIVIAASVLMACAGVMVKTLTSSEAPETIVFYMALFMLLWSLPIAIPFWQSFSLKDFMMVFIVSLFSTAAHLLMARAFVRTEMVVLMPFDFTRLIFTAILAYYLLNETIDLQTSIGALVIAGSAVYIAHREARAKKKTISPILTVNPEK